MSNLSDSSSLPPAVEKVAKTLKIGGWACFWIQIVLAVISALILLFAFFSLQTSEANPGSGGGLFFGLLGLGALGFSIYLAFGYPRLGRKLRSPTPSLRPTRADTTKQVRMALISNMLGMVFTVIGAQAFNGVLFAKALSQPQLFINTAANSGDLIQPLDILLVLGNTHTITAHFVGIAAAIWLLDQIHK